MMTIMKSDKSFELPGYLVALPLPGSQRPLDGFWCRGARKKKNAQQQPRQQNVHDKVK